MHGSLVVTGREALSLRPLDLGGEIGERRAVVADVLASGRGEQASLGRDDDWRRPARSAARRRSSAERYRMEGPGRRGLGETEARQAAPEL